MSGGAAVLPPRRPFRNAADVAAAEAEGIDGFLPARSPYHLIGRIARALPDRLAIRFISDGTAGAAVSDWSYGDLFAAMTRTANLLHTLGVRADSRVAYLLPVAPETQAVMWGGIAACVMAPINHYLSPDAIAAMLERLGAEVLLVHGPATGFPGWDLLPAIRAAAPRLRTMVRIGEGPEGEDIVDWHAATASLPADRLISGRTIRDDDIAACFHTGGTTGAPKFAPQTHLRQAMAAAVASFAMGVGGDDRMLCAMPLFHTGGLMGCGLSAFTMGAATVQVSLAGFRDRTVIPNLWRLVEQHGITFLVGPPTVYAALSGVPVAGHDLSRVRRATSSASGLASEVLRRFEAHAGIRINEAYGLTEATLLVTANPPDGERRPGAVGIGLPFADLRTVRADGSPGGPPVSCTVDEIGLVATRGPMVFEGYLDRLPDDLWLGDGWLNSGDLGRLDGDGYLWITGRHKDLIVRGGHNIDPSLIEEPLSRHPAIALCAAVGKPDTYAGEVPVAFVALKPGARVTVDELLEHARATIAERAAVPKDIIVLDALPMTAVGKVYKLDLRLKAACRAAAETLADIPGIAGMAVEPHRQHGREVVIRAAQPLPLDIVAERLAALGLAFRVRRVE